MNRAIASACAMGATGALVFLILPVLIGQFIEELEYSESLAGTLGSTYFVTYLLASATSVFWSRLSTTPRLATLGYFAMALGATGAALAGNSISIGIALGVAGLGGGMLFSLAVSIISSSASCDRNFGWLLVCQQVLAALALAVIPTLIIPIWGVKGMLVAIALISLTLATTAKLCGDSVSVAVSSTGGRIAGAHVIAVTFGLAALAVHFAGLSALWAFVERIGAQNSLSISEIGAALSLSMLAGLLGALAVTWLGDRYGRGVPIVTSTILFVAVCAGFTLDLPWLLFASLAGLLSLGWNFFLAYQMSIVSDLDKDGRLALLLPASQGLGAVFGPGIGGALWSIGGEASLVTTVAVICLMSGACFWYLERVNHSLKASVPA